MTRELATVSPDETLTAAAEKMAKHDTGALPVVDGKKVIGMVTDRDVVVRGLAKHLDPEVTMVSRCMTEQIEFAYEDEDCAVAADRMESQQIRRLVVLNDDEELTGMVSLGDLTRAMETTESGRVLAGISVPGHAEGSP